MTTCARCKHYEHDGPYFGLCRIELPPMLRRTAEQGDIIVRADDSCDLGAEE